jgi:hypothetical protein
MSESTIAGPPLAEPGPAAEDSTVRPFRVSVAEEDLAELRRRVAATRWPEKETVGDQSQGVQLATIQALARCWATDYDLRRFEARLNAVPQFMTGIDGLAPSDETAAHRLLAAAEDNAGPADDS